MHNRDMPRPRQQAPDAVVTGESHTDVVTTP